MNRGDVFAHKGLGRAGYVVIVSNDGFSAITGHPVVVRVSDRPDLAETPYIVPLTSADEVDGHLECYSVVRVRRDRLGARPVGRVSDGTLRKLDDALALLFDYGALRRCWSGTLRWPGTPSSGDTPDPDGPEPPTARIPPRG